MTNDERLRWNRLSPNTRRLLVSHRRDDFERDTAFREEALADMVSAFGPMELQASAARQEEPDEWTLEERRAFQAECRSYAMTHEEIGLEFGISRALVRRIEANALRKLRHPSRARLLNV